MFDVEIALEIMEDFVLDQPRPMDADKLFPAGCDGLQQDVEMRTQIIHRGASIGGGARLVSLPASARPASLRASACPANQVSARATKPASRRRRFSCEMRWLRVSRLYANCCASNDV